MSHHQTIIKFYVRLLYVEGACSSAMVVEYGHPLHIYVLPVCGYRTQQACGSQY